MKKDIHPTYHNDAVMTCACGATIETGSTMKELSVEICSACHPFYTGKKKFVDTTGRVERFKGLTERSMQARETRLKVSANKAPRVKKAPETVKKTDAK